MWFSYVVQSFTVISCLHAKAEVQTLSNENFKAQKSGRKWTFWRTFCLLDPILGHTCCVCSGFTWRRTPTRSPNPDLPTPLACLHFFPQHLPSLLIHVMYSFIRLIACCLSPLLDVRSVSAGTWWVPVPRTCLPHGRSSLSICWITRAPFP